MIEKRVSQYIIPCEPPNVLWLGNGLNQSFGSESWDKIIGFIYSKNNHSWSLDEIKDIPSNMKIVVASANNVNVEMKELSGRSKVKLPSKEYVSFINDKVYSLSFSNIITTNYTYELEQSVYSTYSMNPQNRCRYKTKEGTDRENNLMLFRYNRLELPNGQEKKIWHIHGELCKPQSMIMGHYYYGYLLSYLHQYISSQMGNWKRCINNDEPIAVKSWIDLFLLGNVYVVGFGMDFSEMDFWWLACLKQREFNNTSINVYEPNLFVENRRKYMIAGETYGINMMAKDRKVGDDEFKDFYIDIFSKELIKI